MKTIKTIRISDELNQAMEYVAAVEKIEESQSLRKLANLGFETYITNLYSTGKLSLREASELIKKSLSETLLLMQERGIAGNIKTQDVLESLESFNFLKNPEEDIYDEKDGISLS